MPQVGKPPRRLPSGHPAPFVLEAATSHSSRPSLPGRSTHRRDLLVTVALGGGNTARNIELLCESCNREKGARIR
ncbi:MAG: HNH endonuclease [Actinobacteria bacterium]|nr:HNH endonuclease [Actinomycetota bacterium]